MSDSRPAQSDPAPLARRRILLVEDNDAACRGLSRLLEASGFEVTTRHDGQSALEVLEAEAPPDFVLTDLQLPDLDGREVARIARQLIPTPRIVLITGWDLDPETDDYASWGIDWVFAKPLDSRSLIDRLQNS